MQQSLIGLIYLIYLKNQQKRCFYIEFCLPTLPRTTSLAPILREGEYPRQACRHYPAPTSPITFFCERNIKKTGAKFPFFQKGWIFFAIAKKRRGSVFQIINDVFSSESLPCVADTTPHHFACTPSARRGISEIGLPTLPRTTSLAPLLQARVILHRVLLPTSIYKKNLAFQQLCF